jgi:iron complex transport system ATP-binding protein
MLKVNNLSFSYGAANVLEAVSFHVRHGELCALFGPNGCGKTTLFKCCLRFLAFHQGSVFLNGCDVKSLRVEEMARHVAYVPQQHLPPFPYLVKEIVLMGRTPHLSGVFGVGSKDKQKAVDALRRLNIDHLADLPYNQLSSGQRQMVLIARAIAQETRLVFLDEPTSALDFSNQVHIWRVMRALAQGGTTLLVCTHDPNHVAWFCDRAVVMGGGRVAAKGDPMQVMTHTLLDMIYGDICNVGRTGDVKLILPREVAERSGLELEYEEKAYAR